LVVVVVVVVVVVLQDPNLPEFWLDMCTNIPTNASGYVNLQLNPERWVGAVLGGEG